MLALDADRELPRRLEARLVETRKRAARVDRREGRECVPFALGLFAIRSHDGFLVELARVANCDRRATRADRRIQFQTEEFPTRRLRSSPPCPASEHDRCF